MKPVARWRHFQNFHLSGSDGCVLLVGPVVITTPLRGALARFGVNEGVNLYFERLNEGELYRQAEAFLEQCNTSLIFGVKLLRIYSGVMVFSLHLD
jgi:hypothetical protein